MSRGGAQPGACKNALSEMVSDTDEILNPVLEVKEAA